MMAQAGQRLNEISTHFGYNVPAPGTTHPFIFTVTIADLERFADLLHILISVFIIDEGNGAYIEFQIASSIFFDEAYGDKAPAFTWGLLEVGNKFLEEQ